MSSVRRPEPPRQPAPLAPSCDPDDSLFPLLAHCRLFVPLFPRIGERSLHRILELTLTDTAVNIKVTDHELPPTFPARHRVLVVRMARGDAPDRAPGVYGTFQADLRRGTRHLFRDRARRVRATQQEGGSRAAAVGGRESDIRPRA